jgi:arginase
LSIKDRNIIIIEARSELGAGTRGASLGPSSIRIRDLEKDGLLSNYKTIALSSYDNLLHSSETSYAKNIGHIYDFNRSLKEVVNKELAKGNFVLLLSGDHSNAIGGVAGFRETFNDSNHHLVWVDAHGDLHSPYTTPSGNMHGMPLAACLGLDNHRSVNRALPNEIKNQWDELKALTKNKKGHLKPEEIFFIGIRDLEQEEWGLIDKLGIKYLDNKVFKKENTSGICEQISENTSQYPIYVSFDVDVIDSALSDGTGTPVPEGINAEQAAQVLNCLLSKENIKMLEITEVNPLLDTKSRTVDLVLQLLKKIL